MLVPLDFGPASGLSYVFLGSVAERIVRTSPVPVLTTRTAALATTFNAKLTLMHAHAMPLTLYDERTDWPTAEIVRDAQIALDRTLEKVRQRFPAAESILVCDDPREGILGVARERKADLIVMGTHGRRGLSRALLGSFAERVVQTSPIAVLTVGARERASNMKR